MYEFVYEAFPGRILFGEGKLADVAPEVQRLDARSVLVISSGSQKPIADRVRQELGKSCSGSISDVTMHVPRADADKASQMAAHQQVDCVVAIGGGSATGLAKSVALERDVSIVAVPSTYAGSEMTDIWGISEHGSKTTGRDVRVVPKTVIYDPDLTRGLPPRLAGPSGLNAIAHSVESLYAENRNPILSMLAEEGIRQMARGLVGVCSGEPDEESHREALYGSFLCGLALARSTMGLHHKLCHVLGGFGLPHAETHAIVLPYATAYNADAAPDAMTAIARALGSHQAAEGLRELARRTGVPGSLAAIGLSPGDLDRAADAVVAEPYSNPRQVDRESLRALLEHAWLGKWP